MPKLRVIIKPPPEPQGDAEQQTEALRDYLLQMSEELAYVLTHLEADNINDSTFERIQGMIPRPYTGLPVMDGDASSGQSEQWARGDHRHGHDSTKADVTALATEAAAREAHEADTNNPHEVTKAQVGLGNVANERQYSAQNPPPLPTPADIGAATAQDLSDHVGDTNNPHSVTAAQVGLGNVDNVQQYSASNPPPVPDAEDVPYDNTQSGLTADDVQEAIDELAQGGGELKSAITYNDAKTQSALLESIGLSNLMTFDGAIHSSGNNFSSITSANQCAVIEVKPNDTIKFKTYSSLLCEFASAYTKPSTALPYGSITGVLASGQSNLRIVCLSQTEYTFTVPATAKYFILQVLDSNVSRIPTTFAINGIDYVLPIRNVIKSNVQALEKTINAVKSQTEVKEKLFGTSSVNASVVTTTGKLYNVLTKAEVDYSSGEYSTLSGLTAGTILSVTGYAWSSNDRYPLYAFYDNSNNLLDTFGEPNTAYTDYLVKVPSGATRIIVVGSSVYHTAIKSFTPLDLKTYIDGGINSIWKDKKIGVLGTSVAFGANASTSYSYEASQRLGFKLRMFGVPGLAIETESNGTPKQYGSFTCTKAEYTADGWTIPDSPVTPYVPGGTYNNYYKTYENVFVSDNADIDLWVYAVCPNNVEFGLSDWNAFNKTEWRYNDNSAFSEHRKTFIGALLFIMDQMYTLNPNARMVFVMDSLFSYSTGLEALNTIAEQWNMPIIDLWGKINICPPSLTKLKSLNGTDSHPSTFAQEIMGKMFAGELALIS